MLKLLKIIIVVSSFIVMFLNYVSYEGIYYIPKNYLYIPLIILIIITIITMIFDVRNDKKLYKNN